MLLIMIQYKRAITTQVFFPKMYNLSPIIGTYTNIDQGMFYKTPDQYTSEVSGSPVHFRRQGIIDDASPLRLRVHDN